VVGLNHGLRATTLHSNQLSYTLHWSIIYTVLYVLVNKSVVWAEALTYFTCG